MNGDAVRLPLAGEADGVEAEDGHGGVEVGVEDVGLGRAVQLVGGDFSCGGRERGGGGSDRGSSNIGKYYTG